MISPAKNSADSNPYKQRHQLRRVLGQAMEASFHITELALDHPERVLNFRPDLRLGFFDLALGFIQDTTLAQFLVGAPPGCNLSDDLATFMLGVFLHSGITSIDTDHVFVAMQQLIDLSEIGHISCRAHHTMHQARLVIHPDMGLAKGCTKASWVT